VHLFSYATNNYVSAEFAWPGANRGILHARPGTTSPGAWETFYITDNSNGTISLYVHDSSGGTYYVAAEEAWTGNGYGTLRARTLPGSVGAWEKFVATDRFIDGHNDYPWANTTADRSIGGWQNTRECDSFVAWKIYENNGGPPYPSSTDQDLLQTPADYKTYSLDINNPPGGIGPDAGDWANNAHLFGGFANQTATVGSVAQWGRGGDGGLFSVGHVALVTAVFPDGSIDIAQYNLLEDHNYSTMWLPKSNGSFGTLPVSFPVFVHVMGF
jgi:hypothetical protein